MSPWTSSSLIDTDRQLAGRYRQLTDADGSDVVSEIRQPDGSWKVLRTTRAWDEISVLRVDRRSGRAWLRSNLGRDKSALVEADLATGAERVPGEHPDVDIAAVQLPPIAGAPVAHTTHGGLPHVTWLDPSLGNEVQGAVREARRRGLLDADPVAVRLQNGALDMRKVVLEAQQDFDTTELLPDRDTGHVERLDPK